MKSKINLAWRDAMSEATENIFKEIDSLLKILSKNKKNINRDVKSFGMLGSGVNELFEKLTNGLDKRRLSVWEIIDED